MGKVKYINDIREFFKKSPVVGINSLKKFLNKKNKDYIYLIINNLLKRGEIKKITKGYYTIHEELPLIVFCLKPSYLGLQDALSAHELWEQETIPITITTRKIRQGIRKVFGNNVLVRRISKKYFFGIEYLKQGDFYFPYSDIEKTFIDMIYFKQYMDNEVLDNFKQKVNKDKLKKYLRVYPNKIKSRVLNKI